MSKKFPDLQSDEEADHWLQSADLSEYDLSEMKKVRFELARKDTSISLRLPAALLAAMKARAIKANVPTQRLIRLAIEDYLQRPVKVRPKPRKVARARPKAA
jgi:predicted DNA binding CopG/RHH family protein